MSTTVDALQMRRIFGRKEWLPPEPFGPDGWRMIARTRDASVIATASTFDGTEWVHASIARQTMPTYEDLAQLHRAVWGNGYAYQCFVPPTDHVNIHEHALHLWGRADGKRALPDFGIAGSI